MALTRRLVEMQGGAIWLESEQDKGTTFNFVLPLEGAGQTQMLSARRKVKE